MLHNTELSNPGDSGPGASGREFSCREREGWDTMRWGKGHMAIRQHQQQLLHEAESWYDDGSAVCASLCWLCHLHVTDADVATCHFFYPPLPLMLLSGEDQWGREASWCADRSVLAQLSICLITLLLVTKSAISCRSTLSCVP